MKTTKARLGTPIMAATFVAAAVWAGSVQARPKVGPAAPVADVPGTSRSTVISCDTGDKLGARTCILDGKFAVAKAAVSLYDQRGIWKATGWVVRSTPSATGYVTQAYFPETNGLPQQGDLAIKNAVDESTYDASFTNPDYVVAHEEALP